MKSSAPRQPAARAGAAWQLLTPHLDYLQLYFRVRSGAPIMATRVWCYCDSQSGAEARRRADKTRIAPTLIRRQASQAGLAHASPATAPTVQQAALSRPGAEVLASCRCPAWAQNPAGPPQVPGPRLPCGMHAPSPVPLSRVEH